MTPLGIVVKIPRVQHDLIEIVWRLGPRPLYELVNGLDRYADLDPRLLAALSANRFAPATQGGAMSPCVFASSALIADPQSRDGAKGPFTTAAIRIAGDDPLFVSLIAFGETAGRLLECGARQTRWFGRDGPKSAAFPLSEQSASKLTPKRRAEPMAPRSRDGDNCSRRSTLERVAFETSRLAEFCGQRELIAQTGRAIEDWPLVMIKELVDNALDASEGAQIPTEIDITVSTERGEITIADNGPGIPPETIGGVCDYAIRVSSREAYVSPSRGQRAQV